MQRRIRAQQKMAAGRGRNAVVRGADPPLLHFSCLPSRSRQSSAAAAPVSLGKGAWDCDNNCEIPPDKEAEVFEEIATMDFPYEGIPTIPPRKNMTHLVSSSAPTHEPRMA